MRKGRDFSKILKSIFYRAENQIKTSKPKMDCSERYNYNPKLQWSPKVEEYLTKAYGAEHFSRISKALTYPSCYSCIRINTLKSTTDVVLKKLLAILQEIKLKRSIDEIRTNVSNGTGGVDVDDKQLSNGVSNNHNGVIPEANESGNASIASLQDVLITKCQVPGLDYVLFVKGSGPHTLDYGDAASAADEPLKEVLVSRKCAEAVLRGAQVFVPGVLACSAHVEIGDRVAVSVSVEQPGSEGKWVVGITRGTVLQGSQTDPYHTERNGLYIGQGTAKMSRAGMFRASEGIAIEMSNRVFDLPSLNSLLEGEIFLQNLPSIITAHALDPQKGERILDMCAAPGGKTTAIAILMRDQGELIATDRSHNKVLDIKKLVEEMGVTCITPYKLDALKSVSLNNSSVELIPQHSISETVVTINVENIVPGYEGSKYLSKAEMRKNNRRLKNGVGRHDANGGRVENIKGFSPDSFDRVLLDAPCSALGLRPRLFAAEESIESLRKHANYQRKMFDQAVQLVRPGGVLVYSTCTINPGENEAIVRYALDKYKFLSLALQEPRIGGPGLVGRCELFDGEIVEEWLRPGEEDLVQRFDPSCSSLDTIGFFIAKFKVADSKS